jgi:hypothetical protein
VAFVLELIVTGQIPGTPIVITFQWVLAIVGLVCGVSIARQMTRQHRHASHPKLEEITL